jgi:Lamin Tail Domain
MKKLYTLLSVILISASSQAQVVISQAYGGGGNGGATYSNDFIELFNRGTAAQSLAGYSIQYASANGSTWARTELPNVMLMPGKYFLVQQAAGATPVLALPTPDLDAITCNCSFQAPSGTNPTGAIPGLAMSGSNGKVILVNGVTLETTANPTGTQILDKVAYGATSTSGFEGTGPTGTALTSTTAVLRNNGGCTDADNNATDFTTGTPAPRNNATPTNACALATKQNTISGLKVYTSNNNLYVTSDSNDTKSIMVYNILGKNVVNTKVTNQAINVADLSSGIYIVKVTENGKTSTVKVVLQ